MSENSLIVDHMHSLGVRYATPSKNFNFLAFFFFFLQITAFLILFLLGGQIENQLLSTGAFEVYLNG